jgi:hypothetical protein
MGQPWLSGVAPIASAALQQKRTNAPSHVLLNRRPKVVLAVAPLYLARTIS